jgi:transposase-like protein/ribosomal protein L40E
MEEDYPRTVLELEERFSTEDACRNYLLRLRWSDGFVCPHCGAKGGWSATRGRIVCRACRHQASVTAGTILQDTHKPLRLWFRAIWHVTSQKNGASAVNVQQILGLGSYATAWTWLHKLRRAMVRPGRDRLRGRVEVDETFISGEEPKGRQRKLGGKALVVIAAEEDGKGIGRIRMGRIADRSRVCLHGFIQRTVEPGSLIHTDGLPAYDGLEALGYKHEASVLLGQDKDAATRLLPRVHRVAVLVKRWLLGTHQGAVANEYLDYYLDEFTFRFNRRTSRSRGKLFYRLLQQAVQVDPVPYQTLIDEANAKPVNHNP